MVNELMAFMGLAVIVTIILIILEKSRQKELYKMVYSFAVLVFFCMVLGMIGQVFGEINAVFHVW